MNQRGIRSGFLWINQLNNRLPGLYQSTDWRFDSLEDDFDLRSCAN
jgi:hypothetical protein